MANWTRFFASFRSIVAFFSEAWFLGRPVWGLDDIPDMIGRVVIVTGGNSGLGRDTVKVCPFSFPLNCFFSHAFVVVVVISYARLTACL